MNVSCPRCGSPMPGTIEATDGGGDPTLLPVIVPADGWVPDGEDTNGGVVCGACATTEEITAWMGGLALVESITDNEEQN